MHPALKLKQEMPNIPLTTSENSAFLSGFLIGQLKVMSILISVVFEAGTLLAYISHKFKQNKSTIILTEAKGVALKKKSHEHVLILKLKCFLGNNFASLEAGRPGSTSFWLSCPIKY